jgi:hypothetical protein
MRVTKNLTVNIEETEDPSIPSAELPTDLKTPMFELLINP